MSSPRNNSGLRSDPLFGGLTRPATLMGLPVEAFVGIVSITMIGFLVVKILGADFGWLIFTLGMGAITFAIARLVCAKDPRALRYIALQLRTKGKHRLRSYWKCGSFAALPNRKRR